jgi:hypothetical protein
VTTEALPFGEPTTPDAADSPVNVATLWATHEAGSWVGNRIRLAATAPSVTPAATAWNFDTAAQLAVKSFTPAGPQLGTDVDVLFDAVVPVVPEVSYLSGQWTDRYAATGGQSWPIASARLYTDSVNSSRYRYDSGPALPDTPSGAAYHVSPIVVFDGGGPEPVYGQVVMVAASGLALIGRAPAVGGLWLPGVSGLAVSGRSVTGGRLRLAATSALTVATAAGEDEMVTESINAKRALFARLATFRGTGQPLAGVQVAYSWPGRSPNKELIYGGGIRFARTSAGHDGVRELWLETATVGVYVRVSRTGATPEETDARAVEIAEVLEELLESEPRLAGKFSYVGIASGSADYMLDDDSSVSVVAYQVQFQYYLD